MLMPAFLLPMLGRIGLKGGVIIALCLALAFVCWRADTFSDRLERSRNELATCEAQHAVTRQSVDTLDAVITDLNNRALARAEAYAQGIEEAEKRSAELAKLSAESDRRIAELRAAAREQVNGDCPVPPALRDLAAGL
jgi:hypothetical protein